MKKTMLTALLSIAVLSSIPVLVQAAESDDKSPQAEQVVPNVPAFDKQMAQSQEYMNKMQEQMDKLRQTQDPQERQKLLQQHWTTMQENMQLMHDIWGPYGMQGPTIGPGKVRGWKHMGEQYFKLTPEQMNQRQYMMDRYVPMQQMMMQQLMQHQRYMWDK